ncbi:conserved exported protein of unknown function [Bradyrhizobium sp. ORS 285]|uniref:hypothetical protein n=1 Tax=unclassified Bradyrhizobium TaxID=2631580 RepID=UPI0002407F09|nr:MULTISPECIES: hypothetical protein [unclassified Bradyrhizobium]CCD89082.1 conserved membrane hypothetical protein [Bradyrhizobium sp. ORS 285]SMX61794.1 conserved exported protein of unknown function [Bradyrhizobium sp. ORS 285]
MISSLRLLAAAAIVATAGLLASAPASPANAGWEWLQNKDYIRCLQLVNGGFFTPANASPAVQAQRREAGRRYCNRQYYGHD